MDAAMLLSSLQPVAHELAEVTAIIHQESILQDVHPMQLDPNTLVLSHQDRLRVMRSVERSGSRESGSRESGESTSFGASEEELKMYVKRRIPIAQGLNACIAEILP